MSKPIWININPLSGGKIGSTLSTEVTATAQEYTGRLSRTGDIKVDATGGASQTANAEQAGKAEHITLSTDIENPIAVLAYNAGSDITSTLSGISNSANLKLASGTAISGVSAKAVITAQGQAGNLPAYSDAEHEWDGVTYTKIGYMNGDEFVEDPGKDAEYSFTITLIFPSNPSDQAATEAPERNHELKVTNAGTEGDSSYVGTDLVTFKQAAGEKKFNAPSLSGFSYPNLNAGASETVSPSAISAVQKWNWNFAVEDADASHTETISAVDAAAVSYAKKSGTTISVDTASGVVTGTSKGTVLSAETEEGEITATVTLNGVDKTIDAVVKQDKNGFKSITADKGTLALAMSDVPAAAGTSAGTVSGDLAYTLTYDSESAVSAAPEGYAFSHDGTVPSVSFESLGTTPTLVNDKAGEGKYDVTEVSLIKSDDSSVAIAGTVAISLSTDIKRAGNFVESISVAPTASVAGTIPAKGGSAALTHAHPVTLVFTSGESALASSNAAYTDDTYGTLAQAHKVESSSADFTATESQVSAGNRGTAIGEVKTATVTFTETQCDYTRGEGYYSGDNAVVSAPLTDAHVDVAVSQDANTATYGEVTKISSSAPEDIPASGGTRNSNAISAYQTTTFSSEAVRTVTKAYGEDSKCYDVAYADIASKEPVTRPDSVSDLVIAFSAGVAVDSLGRTIKGRASVGTLTATVTGGGEKTFTESQDVYQAANAITSYSDVFVPDYDGDPESELTISLANDETVGGPASYTISGKSAYQLRTYTSGVTDSNVLTGEGVVVEAITVDGKNNDSDTSSVSLAATSAVKTAADGFSLSDGTVSVTANPGTEQRGPFVVTYTVTGNADKSFANDINFTQPGADSFVIISKTENGESTVKPFDVFAAAGGDANAQTFWVKSNDTWKIADAN